ncbi:right-handed parallel beta-helix repeat-containing protein [candidate division WOR-3 bacterium]|nr:right-handed parallel beta-helix repeat-containing protein [candidate division WOR-3 bacterium]MCK4525855.1 right-handed parallel beta-helix repeat-containing protein [candidate division WOR-3 bacterium]
MKKLLILVLFLPALLYGVTFIVNQGTDNGSGAIAGSLSWAIVTANVTPGADTIVFDTINYGTGSLGYTGLPRMWNSETYWTITLTGVDLPPLVDPFGVYIMGDVNLNGTPDIVIFPNMGASMVCFEILSPNNIIEGMVIGGFLQDGILIHSLGGPGMTVQFNRIWTCYIGTDIEGMTAFPNGDGIDIFEDSPIIVKRNYVGKLYFPGMDNVENIVSGNEQTGIRIWLSDSNEVGGNHIGVDRLGAAPIPNLEDGVGIYTAEYNIIGTDGWNASNWAGDRNIISGNGVPMVSPEWSGVGIYDGSMWNLVAQNFIGTDKFGQYAIPNYFAGVCLKAFMEPMAPMNNYIGSDCKNQDFGEWNLISGNGVELGYGVYMREAMENVVDSNYIGTDTTGMFAVPNITAGVKLHTYAVANLVGFSTGFMMQGIIPVPGKWNVISGNGVYGVIIEEAMGNIVGGNYIGLNSSGTDTIPNLGDGVHLFLADHNLIGSDLDGASDWQEGNHIAGNWNNGIYSRESQDNTIAANVIGRTPFGVSRGNLAHGIMLDIATVRTIIGDLSFYNTIVNNILDGVCVIDSSSYENRITMNRFGYNGGLAIDLENDGVTPNDPGDNDVGANTLINFPVIDSAYYYGTPGSDSVIAWVSSLPFMRGDLEIYKVLSDPTGYGEGDSVYKRISTTDTIATVVLFGLFANDTISGIVIDTVGNTSEFGLNYVITGALIADVAMDSILSPSDTVKEGDVITPSCWVLDLGTRAVDSFYTYLEVDTSGVIVYNDSVMVYGINFVNDTAVVTFSAWTVGDYGSTVPTWTYYTAWILDVDNSNDTVSVTFPYSYVEEDLRFSASLVSNLVAKRFMLNYTIPQRAEVELLILDPLGRTVAVPVKGLKSPGTYTVEWNCSGYLSSGVYFYILKAGNNIQKEKFVFVK